jgi:hypothetical protein
MECLVKPYSFFLHELTWHFADVHENRLLCFGTEIMIYSMIYIVKGNELPNSFYWG